MEEENIEKKMEETAPLEQRPPGFNWGQIALAVGVVIALLLASWNAFSIMETDKEMRDEDAELSGDIEALDNEMNVRIDALNSEISEVDNRLTEEKNALQSEIDNLQNNVSVLEGNVTEIDNDINNIQNDIQSLQDQLDTLKGRVTALEQACDFDEDGILDRFDIDDDNDGFPDNGDAFPYNATEWKDNDNDGIGDNADPDDDNDGYSDFCDLWPYKDAKVKFTVISFTLEDDNDDVYFIVYIGGKARSPVFWDCPDGWEYTVDWSFVNDIPDDMKIVWAYVYMYDEDINDYNDYLDIEGKSSSTSLYLEYNIVTGEWTGDDNDGYSSGFDDGRTGESDVLFSYNIETV